MNGGGYFVEEDAFGDLYLWRENGDFPEPVVAQHTFRNDPDVWAAILGWAGVA